MRNLALGDPSLLLQANAGVLNRAHVLATEEIGQKEVQEMEAQEREAGIEAPEVQETEAQEREVQEKEVQGSEVQEKEVQGDLQQIETQKQQMQVLEIDLHRLIPVQVLHLHLVLPIDLNQGALHVIEAKRKVNKQDQEYLNESCLSDGL